MRSCHSAGETRTEKARSIPPVREDTDNTLDYYAQVGEFTAFPKEIVSVVILLMGVPIPEVGQPR